MTHYLTPHFTLEEMTRSRTATKRGLANVPGPDAVEELLALCTNILEPLRANVPSGCVVRVNSAFRSDAVNDAVGGVDDSQHKLGQAADIEVPGMSNARLVSLIRGLGLPFDQLLLEHHDPKDPSSGWVHVSHRRDGKNRGHVGVIGR